jgi:hypothetical protein
MSLAVFTNTQVMKANRTHKPCASLVCTLALVSTLLTAGDAFGQSVTAENIHHTPVPQPVPPMPAAPPMYPPYVESDMWLYHPGEFYVDLFAIGATHQGNEFGDTLGVGGSAGYWFTRHFGAFVEAYGADMPEHDATILGALQARMPVDDLAFAIYVFAGGGVFFGDDNGGTFQAGIGVDVRLTDNLSFIFDVRGIDVKNQDKNGLEKRAAKDLNEADGAILYRLGLRFVF